MKLPPDEAAVLREIEDEAIDANRTNGEVRHVAAAVARRDALTSLEAGGITWAGSVRDDAEIAGHLKAIKARLKARRSALPTSKGGPTVVVPAAYSRRRADGSVQLTLWYDLPLAELEALIRDLEAQAKVLTDRTLPMRYGIELARRLGVATAAEAFEHEGIEYGRAA